MNIYSMVEINVQNGDKWTKVFMLANMPLVTAVENIKKLYPNKRLKWVSKKTSV